MWRMLYVIIILISNWFNLYSDSINLDNIFCSGNDYVKIDAGNLDYAISGDSCLWDFGNAVIVDGNVNFRYRAINDSLYDIIDDRGRYKYQIKKDSLYWIGFETRTTKLCDSIAPIVMCQNMIFNQNHSSPYIFIGRYSGKFNMTECGNVNVVYDGKGTLILPDDTITNVMRIKEVRNFHAKISEREITLPLDTIVDTIPLQRLTTYRWYSSLSDYPLAEVRQNQIYDMGEIAYDDICGFIISGVKINKDEQLDDKNDELPPDKKINNISVNNNLNSIDVSFEIETQSSIVEIIITDAIGRVYAHHDASYMRGIHSVNIPISNIPHGDYMIITLVDGTSANKQVLVIER